MVTAKTTKLFLMTALIAVVMIGMFFGVKNNCQISRDTAINTFINQQLDEMVHDTDNYFDSNIYISKYDVSDKELVKKLIIQSDKDKSFEENFGVIAKVSFDQIRKIDKCSSILASNTDCPQLNDVMNRPILDKNSIKLNQSTMKYYIDNNYSYVFDYGRNKNEVNLYPMKNMSVNNQQFILSLNTIDKSCCDKDMILTDIERGVSGGRGLGSLLHKLPPTPTSEIPNISLENLQYQHFEIFHIYKNIVLDKPKDVQKFWQLVSVASVQSPLFPNFVKGNINSFSCKVE